MRLNNEKNFYYCYMPLDSYIYEDWYLNDVKASLELKFHKKDMPNCWSNIDEEKFFSIQEDINRYIRLHFARSEETLQEALDRLSKLNELIKNIDGNRCQNIFAAGVRYFS